MKVLLRNFNVKIIIRNFIFVLSPHSDLFPDSSSGMAPEVTIIHTVKMKLYTIKYKFTDITLHLLLNSCGKSSSLASTGHGSIMLLSLIYFRFECLL